MRSTKINIKCEACSQSKSGKEFRRNQFICKDCESDSSAEYQKKCNGCGITQSSKNFRKNRMKCIECEKAHGRNYRRTTDKAKIWAENNKTQMAELQKKHYETNKLEIRKKERERYKGDPTFTTIKKYRTTVNGLLRGKAKYNKSLQINKNNYQIWLQYYCNSELEFENRKWQIDHVIPLFIFNEKCKFHEIMKEFGCNKGIFAWYNTRAISFYENRQKSANISKQILVDHLDKLNYFFENYVNQKSVSL